MSTYLVTFRFGHSENYGLRLDNFMSRLQTGDWWGETTSSILVHSDETIDAFCRRILSPDCFDERVDMAVVFDFDNRQGRAKGSFRDTSLFTAAPWVRRL
jgi:hypothetical protein